MPCLIAAPGLERERLSAMVAGAPLPVEIVTEDRHRALAASAAALVASGTATLECALLDVPMVVGYRLHPVSYALAKLMVRVPHVALVNLPFYVAAPFSTVDLKTADGDGIPIEQRSPDEVTHLAGKRIVAEAVQNEFNQSRLLAEVKRLFGAAGPAQRQELALVRKALGEPGASARAARAVLAAVREAT